VLVAGVVGCGGGGAAAGSGGVIVRVGGQSVTKGMLDHWTPVEWIIAREPHPAAPLPKGFVPDPPSFSGCASYLASKGATTPVAQLKAQCRKEYEFTRRHMLVILITAAWLSNEAKAQHVTVTNREVEQAFALNKREEYGDEATYQKFSKYTGETTADQLLIVRSNVIVEKLRAKRQSTLGQAGAQRATHEFPKHWAAQTNCAPEYIIPDCKQYNGPEAPQVDI
jgi:hypothetical protein